MKLWRRPYYELKKAAPWLAAAALALAAAGCSAEIGGADEPNFSLNDSKASPSRSPDPRRSDLSGADSGAIAGGVEASRGRADPGRAAALAPSRPTPAKSATIEVQRGDTLSGLAKRHRVSVTDLMTANGLTTHMVKLGQKLALPGGVERQPSKDLAPRPAAPRALPAPPAGWESAYAIRPGDALSVIARRHGVKLAELERVNGITDARRLRPGQVLRVPAREAAAQTASISKDAPDFPAAPSDRQNAPTRASRESAADARVDPREAEASAKLRWPAQGKIVAPFGEREDGTRNDGIDIAVPMGSDVRAAEAGLVVYAGGELAGYGQLVLIRHDNGWVTAYAHNSEVLVARGDQIRRGQVVAKAGNSGLSGPPRLHFELRQASKPVDPTPFMETM